MVPTILSIPFLFLKIVSYDKRHVFIKGIGGIEKFRLNEVQKVSVAWPILFQITLKSRRVVFLPRIIELVTAQGGTPKSIRAFDAAVISSRSEPTLEG